MKKVLGLAASFIALVFLSSTLYAKEMKVGIIDVNTILQKSPLMISLNNDLIKQFQSRQKELADAQKQVQDEKNKLNLNAGTMTADERAKLQDKIVSDQANVDIMATSLQRDVTIAKAAAMQKFTSKLNDVIKQIAQRDNYDMIEQANNILFINPDLNITDKVVSEVK